jgi:hypothetical protein
MCAHHDDEGWEAGGAETRRSSFASPSGVWLAVGVLVLWTMSFLVLSPLSRVLGGKLHQARQGKVKGRANHQASLTHTTHCAYSRIGQTLLSAVLLCSASMIGGGCSSSNYHVTTSLGRPMTN